MSSPGVVKKTVKTTQITASKANGSRLSASGFWQAIQSAPGSVSKLLAPAMSPISSFLGSASNAVSSTFLRMRGSPAVGAQVDEDSAVVTLQKKLEGKTP